MTEDRQETCEATVIWRRIKAEREMRCWGQESKDAYMQTRNVQTRWQKGGRLKGHRALLNMRWDAARAEVCAGNQQGPA